MTLAVVVGVETELLGVHLYAHGLCLAFLKMNASKALHLDRTDVLILGSRGEVELCHLVSCNITCVLNVESERDSFIGSLCLVGDLQVAVFEATIAETISESPLDA